ncbi:MAG: mechanosensitive ion channel family protein [Haloarculaceae archaeon]
MTGPGMVLQAGAPLPGPAATLLDRVLWSVLAVGLVGVAVALLWWSGPLLKARLDEEMAEAIQAAVGTVLGGVGAAVLIVVWQAVSEVRDALGVIQLGPRQGVLLMVSVLVLAGAYTVTRITKRLVKTGVGRGTITAHQREVLHHVVQLSIMVVTSLFVLALWGVRPGRLLLGAGAAGVVIGLAARQTVGSALAGFVLLFARPFEVGDWIVVDEKEGTVTDVSIFNTRLRTFDNEDLILPNEQVTSSSVVNRSRRGRLRITTEVGIDYDADVEKAAALLESTMADLDAVDDHPEPDVVYRRFGDSAVVLELRYWISDPTISRKWRAQNAVVEATKTALETEGIDIPFPQRELAAREEAGGLRISTDRTEASADGREGDR